MIKNYLVTAIRVLLRYKIISAIKIIGLSIAISFCLMTYLYIQHELSFDSFHSKVIAVLTVSWQAIRAATANPVESLRYE